MLDTGCGHDLLRSGLASRLKVATRVSEKPIYFFGVDCDDFAVEEATNLKVADLNLDVNPYLVSCGFRVLSVGKHCREDVFGFIWLGS